MAAQEMAGEVHVDDPPPPCLVGIEEMKHWRNESGVVDEHIDGAVGGHHGVEHGGDLFAIGHVGGCGHRRAPGIDDAVRDGAGRGIVDVVDDDR